MAQIPLSNTEILTPEERWRRWEQRGRENDARFLRRARTVLVVAVLIGAASTVLVLLLG